MTATVTIMPPGADIFAPDKDGKHAEALVNPVNCVGVSGKGLALEFKRRFPVAVRWYESQCIHGFLEPGHTIVYTGRRGMAPSVFFAATKDHWRDASRIEWVRSVLTDIEDDTEQSPHRSLAIPALGCGLGGLPWADVEPLILASATRMAANGCAVKVYPPR